MHPSLYVHLILYFYVVQTIVATVVRTRERYKLEAAIKY